MLDYLQTTAVIQISGIAGCFFTALGILIAAIPYRGKQGERYSPLNHFISELGEAGVSRLAWVFNLGLILGGISLLPCCIGLGWVIPGAWSKLGMSVGCLASIALALVGVFPMNNLKAHSRAATAFFRLALLMILSFTLAIGSQNDNAAVLPKTISLVGVPAVLSYMFFLIYSPIAFRSTENGLEQKLEKRPRFWLLTIAEWLIFITTIPWFFAIALGL